MYSCDPHYFHVFPVVGSRQNKASNRAVSKDVSVLLACIVVRASPDGFVQRMSGVLEGRGVDPRSLSPQQLSRLALFLQLIQAEDKTGGPR